MITATPSSPTTPPTNPSPPATTPAPLTITAITPASGAIGVPLNAGIEMVFSSAVNPATVNSSDVQLTAPNAVAGSVSYDASTDTATFAPAAPLQPNSTYTVTVSGVTSSTGTAMANPFKWSFATITSTSGGTGGGGGSGGNGGTSTSATLQYSAPLVSEASLTAVDGQISIDTTGMMTIQISGAAPSTKYAMQFCPAVNPLSISANGSCMSLGTVSTDDKGKSNSTMKFPQPGSWAGDFNVIAGGKTLYQTWIGTGMSGETYMSTLQPASTVNGTGLEPGPNQDPLTSGTVSLANADITFTVTGTSPNTTFTTSESETVYLDGSGTYALSTFTTDAKGDGTSSPQMSDLGGDIFEIASQGSQAGAGFIGGFSVPK